MRSAVRNPHRRFVRIVVVAALLASTVLTNFALGWERDINGPGDNEAHTIAVTHTGDVVVAGSLIVDRPGRRSANVGVMKLSGPTGTTLWQRLFLGEARRIVIDAQGNAVLAGFTRGPSFAVIKLAGENGAVRWRHRLRRGIAYAAATDARGDVVASGAFSTAGLAAGGGEEGPDWIVLKLARASGAEKWRSVIRGGGVLGVNAAFAVVVDTAGDVIAAGQTNSPTSGPHEDPAITNLTVVKLAGGDGRRIWRYDLTSAAVNASGLASAVQVDPTGDVIVSGVTGSNPRTSAPSDFTVAKLAGRSGLELWRQTISGPDNGAADIAVDVNGDVIAVGQVADPGSTLATFAAVKLGSSDGRELWRVTIDGTSHVDGRASAVALDSAGNAAVVGFVQDSITGGDFLVIRVDPDGRELARYQIANSSADTAWAVAIDRGDRIIAGGTTSEDGLRSSFTVATFP